MEVRAVNICQLEPLLEYAEDLEENKAPVQTGKYEYKQGDKLFVTRILPESATENLCATSTISQKLVEEACQALETQKGLFTLPNCTKSFEFIFAKEDFDILPEHRQ